MIARKIGEQRDIESDPVHAPLVETVRGNFHRHRLGAGSLQGGQRFMQQGRVWSGVSGRREQAEQSVAECSQHRTFPADGVKSGSDPMCARGLAVGAGDADHPQFTRGMSVDEIGDCPKLRLEILERQVGQLPGMIPMEPVGLPENGAGALRDGISDECATVVTRPGVRRKSVALADVTAVRGNTPQLGAKTRQQCGNIGIDCESAAHVSSRTSAPSGGKTTLSMGASGGTPSSRSAAPMMLLKTGAATVPP